MKKSKYNEPTITLKDIPFDDEESENLENNNSIQQVKESSELGETVKELNDDKIEPKTKLSNIDMKTRLSFREASLIMRFDTLVSMGLITKKASILTRTKKRLAVSIGGLGRREIVEIVAGKREMDSGNKSFGGMLKGMFNGGQ